LDKEETSHQNKCTVHLDVSIYVVKKHNEDYEKELAEVNDDFPVEVGVTNLVLVYYNF
jgi:hypothetical protein